MKGWASLSSDPVQVRVSGLARDERNNSPVVILQEVGGNRVLPIWIGPAEASSIALELAGRKFQRPLTHDLLKTVVDGLGAQVVKVLITELRDATFFAKLLIRRDEQDVLSVDARPSDSIAVALRTKAPIMVEPSLFQMERGAEAESEEIDSEALRKFLRDLPPENFGNPGG